MDIYRCPRAKYPLRAAVTNGDGTTSSTYSSSRHSHQKQKFLYVERERERDEEGEREKERLTDLFMCSWHEHKIVILTTIAMVAIVIAFDFNIIQRRNSFT